MKFQRRNLSSKIGLASKSKRILSLRSKKYFTFWWKHTDGNIHIKIERYNTLNYHYGDYLYHCAD
jgi:hypothetical protein